MVTICILVGYFCYLSGDFQEDAKTSNTFKQQKSTNNTYYKAMVFLAGESGTILLQGGRPIGARRSPIYTWLSSLSIRLKEVPVEDEIEEGAIVATPEGPVTVEMGTAMTPDRDLAPVRFALRFEGHTRYFYIKEQ